MTSIWKQANLTCPLCQLPLQAIETQDTPLTIKTLSCDLNHSFDIGKPGYLHLVPVQSKRSKEPGDNKDMVAARKRFLNKGFYQPISEGLNKLIGQQISTLPKEDSQSTLQILDLGCGEGYYTAELMTQDKQDQSDASGQTITSDQVLVYGLDISKIAIQQAAKRHSDIIWLVANSNKIPLPDNSVDIIFSVFSPIVPSESLRILKPNGLLITATAESTHLLSLRQEIYVEVRDYNNDKLEKQLTPQFQLISANTIHHSLRLTESEDVLDLLHMT
ncbi:MAG: methyltransferase domain-containing protein, partial [Pseudomonadales bacterium]|nr:methyltransferase domain-containing protein [Pseudomonadales bacterium]